MFSKWFDRWRAVPFEEVTNARLHVIVRAEVERLLAPKGFEAVGDLKWVNDRFAPIRQVFALTKWKGGTVAPRWGVSIDFVPHLSGNKIRWHRTNKTAKFDLCVDPRENALKISYFRGEKLIQEAHRQVITASVERAVAFWAGCETVSELPAAIERLKNSYKSGDWPNFDTYTQHPLAAAFVLAQAGRTEDALAELDCLSGDVWRAEELSLLKDLISSLKT